MWLFLFSISFYSSLVLASDQTNTYHGYKVQWSSKSVSINIAPNLVDFSSTVAENIIRSSIGEWNNQSVINLSVASNSPNQISFSNDPKYFGPGVLGVSLVSYSASSGKINTAQVYLNQTAFGTDRYFEFTSSPSLVTSSRYFLGDVVTHELGHVFGLSHSEVHDSSMVFSAFRGQSTLALDDISALRGIYTAQNYGSISGSVKGGLSIPIFGAHVQLINALTGEVAGAAFSQDDGTFSISGLPLGDYLVFVSPMRNIETTQSKYLSVKSNFCPSQYVGEFFQGCSTSSRGKPQVINLDTQESKNLGVISIQCSGRFNSDYVGLKFSTGVTSKEFNSSEGFNAWRGFFLPSQVTQETFDLDIYEELIFDLTQEPSYPGSYLKLNLNSEIFGSLLSFQVEVSGPSGTYLYESAIDEFGKLKNNLNASYPLSSTSSLNIINVKIYPRNLTPLEKLITFPSASDFSTDALDFVIIPSITDSLGESIKSPESVSLSDESSCLDGPLSYKVSAQKDASLMQYERNSTQDTSDNNLQSQGPAAACGTIDGGGGGSGGGFLVGLLISLLLFRLFHFPWKRLT